MRVADLTMHLNYLTDALQFENAKLFGCKTYSASYLRSP